MLSCRALSTARWSATGEQVLVVLSVARLGLGPSVVWPATLNAMQAQYVPGLNGCYETRSQRAPLPTSANKFVLRPCSRSCSTADSVLVRSRVDRYMVYRFQTSHRLLRREEKGETLASPRHDLIPPSQGAASRQAPRRTDDICAMYLEYFVLCR